MKSIFLIVFCFISLISLPTSYGDETFYITGFNGTSDYIFNNTLYDPSLNVMQGETITFVFLINTTNHPFCIKTSITTGSSNFYSVGISQNPFVGIGNFTWQVPYSAPTVLYYQDEFNTNMSGIINIEPFQADCLSILNCTECISYSTCNWCSSNTTQGCINNTASFENACINLSGTWGNCNSVSSGTQCYLHTDCQSCDTDPSCTYCAISVAGACLSSSSPDSSFVCGPLGFNGIWNPPCGGQQVTTEAYNPLNPTSATINYNATCQPFAGTVCSNSVFYQVFVNQTFSQTDMSLAANKLLALGSLPGVSVPCLNAATLLTCGGYFLECTTVFVNSQTVALSIPPCRSLCEQVNTDCANEFSALNYPPLNCLSIDPTTGYWTYPQSSIVYDFPNGMQVTLPCNSMQISNDGYFPNILQNPGFEELGPNDQAKYWNSVYGSDNYVIVNDTGFTQVMEMMNNGTLFLGASQTVQLNRNQPLNIRFGITSRADNVSGTLNETFAVQLAVTYSDGTQGGTYVFLPPGNSSYAMHQTIFTPSKPVQNATFFILFDQREGVAYFDNATLQEQIPPFSTQCVSPLQFNPDYIINGQGVCALPCPVLFWPQSQVDTMWYFSVVLSWISFILSIFLTATWILRQKLRNVIHLDSTILYFSVCTIILGFASGFWPSIFGQKTLLCKSDFEEITGAFGAKAYPCAIQAILIQFFSFALLAWWVINIVKLYSVIVFPHTWGKLFLRSGNSKNVFANRIEIGLNIGVWGTSLAIILFGIGYDTMGAGYGIQCWIRTSAYQWSCFYAPLIFCFVIGTPLIIHSMIVLNKTRKAVKKPIHWNLTIRSLALVLFLALNFIAMLYGEIYFEINDKTLKQEYINSVVCRASSSTPNLCPPPPNVSIAPIILANILASSEGLGVFLIFGIQKRNFKIWRKAISESYTFYSSSRSQKQNSDINMENVSKDNNLDKDVGRSATEEKSAELDEKSASEKSD